MKNLVPVRLKHPGHQFTLAVILRCITDHPLIVAELSFQQ
jgi:hypothetical protein